MLPMLPNVTRMLPKKVQKTVFSEKVVALNRSIKTRRKKMLPNSVRCYHFFIFYLYIYIFYIYIFFIFFSFFAWRGSKHVDRCRFFLVTWHHDWLHFSTMRFYAAVQCDDFFSFFSFCTFFGNILVTFW